MPIIVNGQIHDPSKVVPEKNPTKTTEKQTDVDENHHIVINGTKKKLGVKSSYLLDILTIE